jgi:hypothetical protein
MDKKRKSQFENNLFLITKEEGTGKEIPGEILCDESLLEIGSPPTSISWFNSENECLDLLKKLKDKVASNTYNIEVDDKNVRRIFESPKIP